MERGGGTGGQWGIKLPLPNDGSGPYPGYRYGDQGPWANGVDRAFYRDAAVFAYRGSAPVTPRPVSVESSAGPIERTSLEAATPAAPFRLVSAHGTAWIDITYPSEVPLRSASLGTPEFRIDTPMYVELQAKLRGDFEPAATIDLRESTHATVSFAPVRSGCVDRAARPQAGRDPASASTSSIESAERAAEYDKRHWHLERPNLGH